MKLKLVSSKEEIIENLIRFALYQYSEDESEKIYFKERLRKGQNLVFASYGSNYIFCPSRFVGYKNCIINNHRAAINKNGSETTKQISRLLGVKNTENKIAEKEYLKLCKKMGISPENRKRTYWKINFPDISSNLSSYNGFPNEEEIKIDEDKFLEGQVTQVWVNKYERNNDARKKCVEEYGYTCSVCNFNFEKFYGEFGKNFIHVHHLIPISSKGKSYELNAIKDLRPVCPNCHAMLHKTNPPQTIEQLKLFIEQQKIIES
ncbi:MAG: HNH endonuclease [Neisseria sp.]|jgi:5-methylcytosine-specific restriction enzyme A|uniref:HNH endonuclease n=2 Tax=Neisseria TaxID=482 RepID=UPI0008BE03EE|nr:MULTISPECIES: HNH endonuclease [unclassified Neisseria]MDU8022213.1 HNH endonuclease [Neisseria sp.]OFK17358.1 hypothetical protein HMPREF2828_06125 [Neisseria sp. HMSC071A01]OFN00989.1 hypothetical protein HMPREF2633_03315 [Neisseria sp. HMSC072C05]OFP76620.1 hypothetical protein HMPREF2972_06685 [Neisseria sp. HMSC066B07]OHQ26263.1 hypothetical protein HMPREF2669_07640 [Neisseria sp. HMSC066F04]